MPELKIISLLKGIVSFFLFFIISTPIGLLFAKIILDTNELYKILRFLFLFKKILAA